MDQRRFPLPLPLALWQSLIPLAGGRVGLAGLQSWENTVTAVCQIVPLAEADKVLSEKFAGFAAGPFHKNHLNGQYSSHFSAK
ncbi:hypothetical protein [Oscillibacter sp.]|uniref:hypothetical protein n=1 Tax=Oscillibacter sp. TaxID=1945593 RepID=UPI002633D32B|nr:hypothetical protein [Oscillibacter sp.]MDD3346115.1 hypothetical protein [Oscillibacter sp.]